MSFAFAGALQGLGGGIMKLAEDRRRLAQDLLKMEKKADLDKEVAESRAASKARHRKGKGSGGGSSKGRALSNTESDNLARLYKNYDEAGAFEGQAPSLAEFEAQVEKLLPDAGSLSQAAEMARGMWGGEEVTTTTLKERAALSPARLWDDDGKYEDTRTETKYGFRKALDGATAAAPAPTAAPGAASAAPAVDPAQAIEEARAAIQRGADRNAVIARLREMGIEPKGL